MRVWNFSAGPAMLPQPVLERARDELLDYRGSGMSVTELGHRGELFRAIAHDAEQRLRRLMGLSEDFAVLFLQGGAQLQFSAVPLNLLADGARADYVDTGIWSTKAIKEAARYGTVNVAASSKEAGYTHIPERAGWRLDPGAAYLHYTPNETIGGVEFHQVPDAGEVPLVADMSSCILSRPIALDRFGLIYAGAQKNIGIAGLTVVIVRRGLLGRAQPLTPSMLDYQVQEREGSMANTAPTFAWYMAGLVFQWLEEQGGLPAMDQRNERKARTLYECIDRSNFYSCPVASASRSRMNVPFTLAEPALDDTFLSQAAEAGLTQLRGHRALGGMRASLYNAMPQEGVDALVRFMHDFEQSRA